LHVDLERREGERGSHRYSECACDTDITTSSGVMAKQ